VNIKIAKLSLTLICYDDIIAVSGEPNEENDRVFKAMG
jgi:hypothetical protein